MKVKELIAALKKCNPELPVRTYSWDRDWEMDIEVAEYVPNWDGYVVTLCSRDYLRHI